MTKSFAVTWDYRCPFAYNAHAYLIAGLRAGADWDVSFLAFSLDQSHVEEGNPPVWDEQDRYPGLLANLAGIVVRDRYADQFLDVHQALFTARHDRAIDLRDRKLVAKVLDDAGVDAASVLAEVDDGWPLKALQAEHTDAAERFEVFGVPTFISGDQAVFVRLMDGPADDDGAAGIATVERIIDLIQGWPELNEFKHTTLSR